MSNKKDNSLVAHSSQENSADKCQLNSELEHRRQVAQVTLLEFFAALVTSAMMTAVLRRLGLLAEGGWLPGMGDTKTVAALTNKPERTVAELVGDNPRQKFRVGKHPYYRLAEFALPDTRRSTGVAPKK